MNCRNCGTELPAGAMFCGECGTTVVAPRLVEPHTRPRPGDTAIITPVEPRATTLAFLEPEEPGAPERPEPAVPQAPEPWPAAVVRESAASPAPAAPPAPAAAPIVPAPAPAPSRAATPIVSAPAPAPTPANSDAAPAQPSRARISLPEPPVVATSPRATSSPQRPAVVPRAGADLDDDVEATRIVGRARGDRFVLQFSTGENATVYGTGLIGRNPVLQPGEYVDQLVTIVDPGKSVSKTHLEFGQTAGAFWVVDRFSANGTTVRQPDAPARRLDPGKRQPIARGSRVDIGEQFFVVS